MNHSGLIGALLSFLTACGEREPDELAARDARLRAFLNVFADMPLDIELVHFICICFDDFSTFNRIFYIQSR